MVIFDENIMKSIVIFNVFQTLENTPAVRPYADRTRPVRPPYAPRALSMDGCGWKKQSVDHSARVGCRERSLWVKRTNHAAYRRPYGAVPDLKACTKKCRFR